MGLAKTLIGLGLTNHGTEDIGALAMGKRQREVFAFCTSEKCCTQTIKKVNGKSMKRHYSKILKHTSQDVCPDCGAYLIHKKERRL